MSAALAASARGARAGLSARLGGGDRRSIGVADEIAGAVLRDAALFAQLWDCLADPDPLVRMRAADVLEKVSRTNIEPFVPHRQALLALAPDDGTKEVRWHLVAIAARLPMSEAEAGRLLGAFNRLMRNDDSRIVKAAALEGAVLLAERHAGLRPAAAEMLDEASRSAIPSLQARARRLGRSA